MEQDEFETIPGEEDDAGYNEILPYDSYTFAILTLDLFRERFPLRPVIRVYRTASQSL